MAGKNKLNPIIKCDYPDVDVIRVDDTYYMISTTMYFMPGAEILRSYDLIHWEHAAYVYDRLDSTPGQRLDGEENVYGSGMWAASLRYNKGTFYVCFVCNDTGKTYLYRSDDIKGPWKKSNIKGFFHDCSLLFDDDGKVYIAYGNRNVYVAELNEDLTATVDADDESKYDPSDKRCSYGKLVVRDRDDAQLGYEGSHFYKINGKYYLFFIHMPRATGKRTESCFVSDVPMGEYIGYDVCDDDMGFHNSGAAQGGIVDTPSGKWYAMLFQDSGAVGRLPVLIPVTWKDDMPVFGDDGKIPDSFETEDLRPGYEYTPLTGSDDFKNDINDEEKSGSFGFLSRWQFSHEPDLELVNHDSEKGIVRITTGKIAANLVQAKNVLTQRTHTPECCAEITVDGTKLGEGDYAGLCMLQSSYGFISLTRREGKLIIVTKKRFIDNGSFWGERNDKEPGDETGAVSFSGSKITFGCEAVFDDMKDTGRFYYKDAAGKKAYVGGDVNLKFLLDHFTGARFGLFVYSTKETGGSAEFSDFRMIR